jgi:hypothetical protein
MRGVLVFTVHKDLATHLRFYLEPVEDAPDDVDRAVARLTGGGAS